MVCHTLAVLRLNIRYLHTNGILAFLRLLLALLTKIFSENSFDIFYWRDVLLPCKEFWQLKVGFLRNRSIAVPEFSTNNGGFLRSAIDVDVMGMFVWLDH